jgi:hypothetical protein
VYYFSSSLSVVAVVSLVGSHLPVVVFVIIAEHANPIPSLPSVYSSQRKITTTTRKKKKKNNKGGGKRRVDKCSSQTYAIASRRRRGRRGGHRDIDSLSPAATSATTVTAVSQYVRSVYRWETKKNGNNSIR